MNRKERIFLILAYIATAIMTLLPFLQVGFTNSDDFQYYNTAHVGWSQWVDDAMIYATGAGRFYFVITKYFYYVPYLIDSVVWTKLTQYVPLIGCYVLFSYLVFRIFKSKRLGALTLLLLIFNMSVGLDMFYPPTAFPFYFSFSLLIFLTGILLFVNYTERNGYWRIILSAFLFLVSYLFYENYLVFTIIFVVCFLIRRWRSDGFVAMLKHKQFYKELVPYAVVAVLYVVCYFGYRHYLINTYGHSSLYGGSVVSNNFSFTNFLKLMFKCTIYTLPGMIYRFDDVKAIIAQNSQFISGHYNSIGFVITHAPVTAYFNALIQCVILWFLMKKAAFSKITWKALVCGVAVSLSFAFLANALIAVTGKYNDEAMINWIRVYVTSFYSYFGVMLTIAIVMAALFKIIKNEKWKPIIKMLFCVFLFVNSIVSFYTNNYTGMEWKKSQNRIIVLESIKDENAFEDIPLNSIMYIEILHNTSYIAQSISHDNHDFDNLISRIAGKYYNYARTWDELQAKVSGSPDAPIYFIQATETKKNCELLLAISHISHYDSDIDNVTADKADVYYYSPTKNYVLFYSLNDGMGSVEHKSVGVISNDIHKKITHVKLEKEGMRPLGFSISNMVIQTSETVWLQ